jgi:hypothetical protein
MATIDSDTCNKCGRDLIDNYTKVYKYCPTHPEVIAYNAKGSIIKQNNAEWESLRRLESGE